MRTTRLRSRSRQDQGNKWMRITMAVLATIGVIDTASITLKKWGFLSSLTCPGSNQGCDQVLNSVWGTVNVGNAIQLPLSFLGLMAYGTILILSLVPFLPGLTADRKQWALKISWLGLFLISCSMTVFSLILIWLLIYKIQAFCFFCVLSACISLMLLALSFIGGNWEDSGQVMFKGIILSIVVMLSGFVWATSVDPAITESNLSSKGIAPKVQTISTNAAISLAKHLKTKGAVIYSAYWCPHCHDQKELFGKEATKELKVIECASDGENSQADLCNIKGITGYPSWEINGKIYSGIISLEELSDLSKYSGSRKF